MPLAGGRVPQRHFRRMQFRRGALAQAPPPTLPPGTLPPLVLPLDSSSIRPVALLSVENPALSEGDLLTVAQQAILRRMVGSTPTPPLKPALEKRK